MTKDARTRFTFRLPEELYETLKDKAAVKGVSVNAIILQILWEWLEHNAAGEHRRQEGGEP